MTKRKSTKRTLLLSALSLLMCVSMLIGSTFAWFTDSVTFAGNKIQAGNLVLDLELLNKETNTWNSIKESKSPIFNYDKWEPGYTDVKILKIENEGNLSLKWYAKFVSDTVLSTLADVIDVFVCPSESELRYPADRNLTGYVKVGTVTDFVNTIKTTTNGTLLGGQSAYLGIALKMQESAGNEYQGLTLGEFDIQILATQQSFESDSFSTDYDANAVFPSFDGSFYAVADISGKVGTDNKLTEDVTVGDPAGKMHAVVPRGTMLNPGTTKLELEITTTDRSGNIEMTRGQVSRSLDVHIGGISGENTVPATVDLGAIMPTELKDSSIQLYHVENGTPMQMAAVDTLSAHNQFVYNADSGEMSVNMATFSEVTAVVAIDNPWDGKTRDVSWYNTTATEFTLTTAEQFAGFGDIVGGMATGIEQDDFAGKTIKLGDDLNLGGLNNQVWYPIGYHNSNGNYDKVSGGSVTSNVSSFEGIFDGQGHTISNIYQNTWEMFGDYNNGYSGTPNHYKDGMGLFGFVFNGTIRNLIVDNFQSDGEFCTTGVVAAYASGSSNFENITITNSNPRAYNVPNGGVVGYAYDNKGATNVINFDNIKVDTSNKITALWGSYDVGCGGILGRVNGATTVNMKNCEVGAEIDVFNDVCGNYQYYQYRYSGMLIGTVGGDSNPYSGDEKVNFKNVKVYIGNWADYYYCEFEKNSQGSYTDDFQFSRVEKHDINFNDETNMPDFANRPCKHEHTANEDKMGLYLPFNQLYTGYGWGSSPKLITEYGKEVDGVTVYRSFYSVTYMDATGENVLGTEYVTGGTRTDEKLWADEYDVKDDAFSTAAAGKKFKCWVNVSSEETTSIQAGNRNDVVLYESWENPYTIRFVDQFGNVVYAQQFTGKDTIISVPPEPTEEGLEEDFKIVWEDYDLSKKEDITVKAVYTYCGALQITPVYENNVLVYYKVEAVEALPETVTIPGYINGVPVKLVEKLYKNDKNWDFGAKVTTIIIKEGVEELAHNSLGYTKNLSVVKLPSTIKTLGKNTFSRNTGADEKVITIEYNGTMADWEKVEKHEDWHNGLKTGTRVICSDGYYELTAKEYIFGAIETYDWKPYPNN